MKPKNWLKLKETQQHCLQSVVIAVSIWTVSQVGWRILNDS